MGDQPNEFPREETHRLLEELTKEHEGDEVTIELLDQEFGDASEVERLPLAYIDYDPKDDVVVVAVGGRDPRYPVVLRHFVEHPQRVLADSYGREGGLALDILGSDGSRTIVTLQTPSL